MNFQKNFESNIKLKKQRNAIWQIWINEHLPSTAYIKNQYIGMLCYLSPMPNANHPPKKPPPKSKPHTHTYKTSTYRVSDGDHPLTVHGPWQVYYGVISTVLIDHDLDKSPGVIGRVKDHGITWNSILSTFYIILYNCNGQTGSIAGNR